MEKSAFTLFYSMPLDAQDWSNLTASRVKRVMLMLPFADHATLQRLAAMGISVAIRVPEDGYYDGGAPGRIRNQALACAGACRIEAVIVGNEPENGINLHYGSPDWGQAHAYEHRRRFDDVRMALQAAGFAVVSPGWTYDDETISEDGRPAPGKTTWREIVTLPQMLPGGVKSVGYNDVQYNGFHLYQFDYPGLVNELRVKFGLKHAQEMWHKPLWIDECNINKQIPQLTAMKACIALATFLRGHRLGERVVAFTPFVSNGDPGNPPVWPSSYLMRDPTCYAELGQWMAG